MSTALSVEPAPRASEGPSSQPPTLNDLTIRVGTVNGSGSQSANLVLLRALYGMGIPCSGKNIFPSNIEGLPTWFHLRANGKGYVGHEVNTRILVSMHEPTAQDDLKRLRPGSVCIYRDDMELVPRDDVIMIRVPFVSLAAEAYPDDKKDKSYRDKLRKVVNMVYVGVVAYVTGIEMEMVEAGIRREFPGRKAKAADINIAAASRGFAWAKENLTGDYPFRVKRIEGKFEKILIEGNKAAALGTVFGGANVVTWYPITPSSSLAEYAEDFFKKHRVADDGKRNYAVVQAEDEIAAVGMAIGAGWAGARALTATSGPGVSLMTEFVGLSYFAEIPIVIINVQRMGPSTGLPTRTCQGDVVKMHMLGHGDPKHPVIIPGSVAECYEFTMEAIDLSQELQTTVFVATDLDLGMNLWLSDPFNYPTKPLRNGKLLTEADVEKLNAFARYRDVDGDGVCYRTIPGTHHPNAAYFTRGTGHNDKSGYSEKPEDWSSNLDRLNRKFETARQMMPKPEIDEKPGTKVGLIAYGSSHVVMAETRDRLAAADSPTNYCRLRALPVADEAIAFIERHDRVYVIEQNRDGQVCTLLRSILPGAQADKLVSVTNYDGIPLAAETVIDKIHAAEHDKARRASTNGSVHKHAGEPSA